ncbi:hypothetical protein CR513_22855, partial [Mucuna pruriens]
MQNEYILIFFIGLNESFSQICCQIFWKDPLLSMNQPFVVQNNNNSKNKNDMKDHPLCAYFSFHGYSKEKCFKLHNYHLAIKSLFSFFQNFVFILVKYV